MIDFVLKNGFIVSPEEVRRGDIAVRGGKIVDICENFDKEAEFEYDISGLYVLPGVIDCHVHFREPGSEEKEDFETGSRAAVSSGVTTVLDMPNNDPACVTARILEDKRTIVRGRSFVNYGFYLGVSPSHLEEIDKVRNIAGLKYFMGNTTGTESSGDILEKVFNKKDMFVAVHAEDEATISENLAKMGRDIEPEQHSHIRSRLAAYKAVKTVLHLAKKYDRRVHICHVSCREELKEILAFKSDKITFEVTPHHLFLTDEAYEKHRHFVKVNPPLREEEDCEALWDALKAGKVDIIASDHAPHLSKEKERGYHEAPSGVPGVETLLPLLLDSVNHGELNLEDVVRVTSYNPARIFGIRGKGKIAVGKDADLAVVDMNMEREVRNEKLYTKCGWSPFHGKLLRGWPVMTVVNGRMVFRDGAVDDNFRVGKEVKFGK